MNVPGPTRVFVRREPSHQVTPPATDPGQAALIALARRLRHMAHALEIAANQLDPPPASPRRQARP